MAMLHKKEFVKHFGRIEIIRIKVPGGWLYVTSKTGPDGPVTSAFVPDSKEGPPPLLEPNK